MRPWATVTSRSIRTRLNVHPARLWLLPTLMATIVMAALAAMYIGSIARPADHLNDFPIAVVNADHAVTTNGQKVDVGAQIAAGLDRGLDHDRFDVQHLTLDQAREKMGRGTVYGAIVLPQDLSRSVTALASAVGKDTTVTSPTVQVLTNPQAGSSTVPVVTNLANSALSDASQQLGRQLISTVTKQARAQAEKARQNAGGAQNPGAGNNAQALSGGLSGAARLALSDPLSIRVTPYQPLPKGSGNGLIPFYYALALVLAGFTGSLIASTLVDNDLGAVPSEIGPRYVMRPRSNITRLQTLALKWGVMVSVAVLTSAVDLGLARWIGVHIDHPWTLWLYGILVISAVAFVAQTVNAILGGLGMIVNLFIFVILALPSAGGSMPLEETPAVYRWLGAFEPMHQIYLGTRAIIFYDARWNAGLGRAVIFSIIAGAIGLLVGLIVMRVYDARGFVRSTERAPVGSAGVDDGPRDQVEQSRPEPTPAAGTRSDPAADRTAADNTSTAWVKKPASDLDDGSASQR